MSGRVTVRLLSGKKVVLPARAFVAAGGEGSIYAARGTAYKIYEDPARAIAAGKIAELRRIAHPGVLVPRELLVRESDGVPIGYAMPFVPDAWSWTQLVPPAFWARHGLTVAHAIDLCIELSRMLAAVHAAGCCVGDLSGNNVLVAPGEMTPRLVDTDSFATPSFAATAITPEIADPRAPAGCVSPATDWFAFAVLVFELFTGLHPFKGKHPTVKGMAARMQAGISAFRSEVAAPAAWRGTGGIPLGWVGWLRGVLEGRTREPASFAITSATTTTSTSTFVGVRGRLSGGERFLVEIDRVDGVLRLSGGRRSGLDFVPASLPLSAAAIVEVEGQVIALCGDKLLRLDLVVVGSRVFVGTVPLASVLPHATRLWPGIAISDVAGQAHGYLLDGRGARIVRLPDLDRAVVVDAWRETATGAATAAATEEIVAVVREGARLRRLTFRVSPHDTVAVAAASIEVAAA